MGRGDSATYGRRGMPATGQSNRGGLSAQRVPGIDGRISRRVLGRLGLDVDVGVDRYRGAYQALLPRAGGRSLWGMLRDAQLRGEVIEAWDPDRELEWLSDELRIARFDPSFPALQRLWERAVERSGLGEDAPNELSSPAKRILVERLATASGYTSLAADALAEALRYEANR